jgi:nitrate reductase NapA
MSMNRRDLIRTAAMGAAAAALSRAGGGIESAQAAASGGAGGIRYDKAPCRFCGTGCHVQVGVQGGRIVSIRGDEKAAVNNGLLCMKGYHVGLALYGKDRLTQPLLRKNGALVPVSWPEAIDVIAERVQSNPKGFAIYGSGQWTIPEGYGAMKLMKGGLGSNHLDANARLCMASAVTGFLGTYGVDEPASCFDDLDRADVVLLWGNNPAEMHPILFSRIVDRRARGEKVVIVDIGTRRTRTTQFADHYLEFKPHTDTVVANAIAHLLVYDDGFDKAFVERHCAFRVYPEKGPTLVGDAIDFETYKRSLAPYTPERCAELSGVPAHKLREIARMFANRDLRITSLWCMGANQHTAGTAINHLLHAIHLLSGHWGREGDGPQSLTGQPSACGTVREVGTLAHALPGGRVVDKDKHREFAEDAWSVPRGRVNPKPGYHTVKMWESFSTPTDKPGGDITTLWVQVTNPAQSMPNTHKLIDPSRKLKDKFLIVSDVYPTATTAIADLVLPSALWVEKNGMTGNSERRTQQWFKMVDPPGDARDDLWQLLAVAHRLFELGEPGMKNKDGEFLFAMKDAKGQSVPFWDWAHYYDINVDERLFEEYRGFTRMKHKDLAPYSQYVAARGLRWPVVEKDGVWKETRYRFVEGEDPYVTAGKGIDFYHSTTENGRAQIWFHEYTPPPESPDAEYPFWLCTGRVIEHWHTGTMTMRIPQLQRSMPQAYVELNRQDARRLGIENGDLVLLETRRGQLRLPAWLDGRSTPPAGSLFVPFFDEKLLINELTLDAHDPLSKQPDYKKCAARVRKV